MTVRTRAAIAKDDKWLESKIAPIQEVLRRNDYEMLGPLSFVNCQTPDGTIHTMDFRQTGPWVAQAQSFSQIVLVTPWEGLPLHVTPTQQPCLACVATCPTCGGTGKKTCEAAFCGGTGKLHLPLTHEYVPNGPAICHDCPTCGTCNGTGKATCSKCRGQRKTSTGMKDGATEWDESKRDAENRCPECLGRKYHYEEIEIPLTPFIRGRIGRRMILGHVIRFSVHEKPPGRKTFVFDVTPDIYGDLMSIVLDRDQPPCQAWLVGGNARLATR